MNARPLIIFAARLVALVPIACAAEPVISLTPPLPFVFPDTPPSDCPFPKSDAFTAIQFTGRYANYTEADTWYPSWGADDRLYSPFTDGTVNGLSSWSFGNSSSSGQPCVGHAVIAGADPLALTVGEQGLINGSPAPYGGRYPCGSLHYNGVWYIGTYGLNNAGYGGNWAIMGPCAGFHISRDNGQTWTPSPRSCSPQNALFPEPAQVNGPVKFGSPHFVDFGKNMQHSPDGKAYLCGHGSQQQDQADRPFNLSWITGDQIYLSRVIPTPETINDGQSYEYFAGGNTWSRNLSEAQPIAAWNNHMGCVTMTWNEPLKRYFMCVTDGGNTTGTFNTYLLESTNITGPWKRLAHWNQFGKQAYFVNIPSKFISKDGKTMWLCYSANFINRNSPGFENPPGSRYAMHMQEVRLHTPQDPTPVASPLVSEKNLARKATVSVSSTYPGYAAASAVDGRLGGYPDDISCEWAANGERAGAWLKLEWPEEQAMDRIWLFDRPNSLDQVISGTLTFSDGSTIEVNQALPDDGQRGVDIKFPEKKVRWVKFTVTGVKPNSPNIGLSEIVVTLRLDEGNDFDGWCTSFNLTGEDAAKDADSDGDGISNLIEYALGGNPRVASNQILPAQSFDNDYLVLSYKRNDDSRNRTVLSGQWATDLANWTDIAPEVVNDNGSEPDDMGIKIPLSYALDGMLFGRLLVSDLSQSASSSGE